MLRRSLFVLLLIAGADCAQTAINGIPNQAIYPPTPAAVTTTGNMTAGLLGLGGCQSILVTISGATVGVNAATASPMGMPTSTAATAGLVNVTAYVNATNTVTVSVCALAALTTAAIPYKVLLY